MAEGRSLEAALLDEARGPLLAVDRDGRVLHANAAACRILGRKHEGVIGEQLAAFLHPSSADALGAALSSAQGAPDTLEVVLGDGTTKVPLVIRALDGSDPHAVSVRLDIFGDVRERELQNEIMREFLRNAAHQLRTPLTGIATAVEVLQAGAKNEPDQLDRFLEHIETHSQRLVRIARGLLVLAWAQSGYELQVEAIELRPVLDGLARLAAPPPGVRLEVDCEQGVAVLAERDLIQEALAALVENALAHTAAGSIELSATETDGRVAISVTDTGPGIAAEYREHIFEPFYPSSPPSGDRFGLGLTIAAEVVRAMKGELVLDDAAGGARFTVRLPSGTFKT